MRHSFIALAFVLAAILIGCSNSKNNDNSSTEPDMPAFEQKFPQKSIWVHQDQNDSTEITFSSMEEAEWKLVHKVSHHEFCDAFVQVLLSDPSSMDYPFDSLSSENFCGIFKPAVSDDGNARFIGLEPDAAHQIPYMIVQYKNSGRVWIAEEGYPSENCFYCLTPDTVFTLNTGTSTLYLAWGYGSYTGRGDSYRLCAYELDKTGLHPAFVFEEGGVYSGGEEEAGQSLDIEICTNDELYKELAATGFRDLCYFNSKESAVYIRIAAPKEADECGCSLRMTNQYCKYVWKGNLFKYAGECDYAANGAE